MNFNPDQWAKCRKCGSLYPAEWARCGRCGHTTHVKSGVARSIRLLLIALVFIIAYSFRGELLPLLYSEDKVTEPVSFQNVLDEDQPEDGSDNVAPLIVSEPSPVIAETPSVKPAASSSPSQEVLASSSPSQEVLASASPSQEVLASAAPVQMKEKEPEPLPSPARQDHYTMLYNALIASEDNIMLPGGITSEQVFAIIQEIVREEPRVLFYEGCSYRSDGLLTMKYSKPKEFIIKADAEVRKKAEEIISALIRPDMTDIEKELALHDYVVNNCKYDSENLKAGTIPPEAHSAYGVLINRTAVCEGYAKAMKLLFDMADIESRVVTGKSLGQLHAWNLVRIEGAWYHIDATWDDPVMSDGGQTLQYTYFNLPDALIRQDHSWDKSAYPACDQTKYNYFTYFKATVSSPDEFLEVLVKKAEAGQNHITLKILNYSPERYDVPDLIQKAVYLLNSGTSYSVNESYGIVQVWIRNEREN